MAGLQEERGITPDYMQSLERKSRSLVRTSIIAREATKHAKREFLRSEQALRTELEQLHSDFSGLDSELKTSITRARHAVSLFRDVAQRKDIERLNQRVSSWSPEKRISRESFKRLLEDDDISR